MTETDLHLVENEARMLTESMEILKNVEKQVADHFRNICGEIFSNDYRLNTAIITDHRIEEETIFVAGVASKLTDASYQDTGEWYGDEQFVRITPDGAIYTVWISYHGYSNFNPAFGDFSVSRTREKIRLATDHEIAICIEELSKNLLKLFTDKHEETEIAIEHLSKLAACFERERRLQIIEDEVI